MSTVRSSLTCLELNMVMIKTPDIAFILPNLAESSKEPKLEAYFSKLISLCRPLSRTHNLQSIDHYLTEIIPSYIALKMLMVPYIANIIEKPEDATALIQKINSEIFGELSESDSAMFNETDRSVLLKVLSRNMQLAHLFLETPEENTRYRDLAYIVAFAALQKIDLIFTAIFLIAKQEIKIDDRSVVHKLCLAIKRYLREVETAFFMNNPVLINRLRKPCKNISNADMERLLELSD